MKIKKIYLLTTLFLFSITCISAQTDEREKRSVEYRDIRLNYAKSKEYNPYSTGLIEIRKKAEELLNKKQYTDTIAETEKGLKLDALNIHLLILKAAALRSAGKENEADAIRQKWMSLLDSIVLGKDGRSFETAFEVISVDEEYALLMVLHLQRGGQQQVESDGHQFDILNVTTKDGNELDLYFNIDIPMKWLQTSLTKRSDTK